MQLNTYTDARTMMTSLAAILADDLKDCIATQGKASFVVPGGTTPGPIFDALAATPLDWGQVHVMLSDERWVPEDNPRSNTQLIKERLLTGQAAAASYVPLYKPAETPEAVLAELAQDLAPHLPISVLLLGMGADMHTASLFPGADRLEEGLATDAPPLLPMRAPGAPEPRVTLTAPYLAKAQKTHIVITGEAKRAALETAQGLPVAEAPVAAVLQNAQVHWAES